MYSMIQLCAIIFFFISFLPPFWIWGHLLALVVFLIASHMARTVKRQKQILQELKQKEHKE